MALVRGRVSGATQSYQRRLADQTSLGHFRARGALRLSSIGIGTSRGDDSDEGDALQGRAVLCALEGGVNVVDTAATYRGGRAEGTVGAALREAAELGIAAREEVLVSSKAGYLPLPGPGATVGARIAELKRRYIEPGVFRWEDLADGRHCIAPRYLEETIAQSRERLGLETIDIYFLHNPEVQLRAVGAAAFAERLRAAFAVLEQACAAGAIGCYGIATWAGLRAEEPAPEHLSLVDVLAAARDAGGPDHHLRALQLPFNSAMVEALARENQRTEERPAALLDAAARLDLYVMTSASIHQGRGEVATLALLRRELGLSSDAQRALQFARSAPGVGTALVGMNRLEHLQENLELVRLPPASGDAVRALVG